MTYHFENIIRNTLFSQSEITHQKLREAQDAHDKAHDIRSNGHQGNTPVAVAIMDLEWIRDEHIEEAFKQDPKIFAEELKLFPVLEERVQIMNLSNQGVCHVGA